MNISLSSTSSMEVLALHAWSQCDFGDGHLVLALGGWEAWRADVGCSSAAGGEGAVAVVAYEAFADDLAVAVGGGVFADVAGS